MEKDGLVEAVFSAIKRAVWRVCDGTKKKKHDA